jgi:hypothetical protein
MSQVMVIGDRVRCSILSFFPIVQTLGYFQTNRYCESVSADNIPPGIQIATRVQGKDVCTTRGNIDNIHAFQGLHVRWFLKHDISVLVAVSQRAPHHNVACISQRNGERRATTDLRDVDVIEFCHLSRVVVIHRGTVTELIVRVLSTAIHFAKICQKHSVIHSTSDLNDGATLKSFEYLWSVVRLKIEVSPHINAV